MSQISESTFHVIGQSTKPYFINTVCETEDRKMDFASQNSLPWVPGCCYEYQIVSRLFWEVAR